MTAAIVQSVELGSQWPTLDPFLFCAHHRDRYPPADGKLGPSTGLAGRAIGQDFSGRDGWSMYHGAAVPGFPQHPHRGFETVTYVREGWCDHSDSLGAQARFGEGDVQWLTAGAGIVHSEMFPLFDEQRPNPLHLFQIWLNLPRANKMVDPYFSMLWRESVPTVEAAGGAGEVTVIAGSFDGVDGPTAPPDSWASQPDSHVAIWHIRVSPGCDLELPPAVEGCPRVLYLFEGDGLLIGADELSPNHGAVLEPSVTTRLRAGAAAAECLVLQGRPIGEPVAQQGPFVMNETAEIEQAMIDYRSTGFGGWPWAKADPVHGSERTRFARHVGGRTEQP